MHPGKPIQVCVPGRARNPAEEQDHPSLGRPSLHSCAFHAAIWVVRNRATAPSSRSLTFDRSLEAYQLSGIACTCNSSIFAGLEVPSDGRRRHAKRKSCHAPAGGGSGRRGCSPVYLEEAEAVAQTEGNNALTAGFVCQACAHEWSGSSGSMWCPKCGHPYVSNDAVVQRTGGPRRLMLQPRLRSQGVLSLEPTLLRVGYDQPTPEAVARPRLGQDLVADEMSGSSARAAGTAPAKTSRTTVW